MSNSTRCAACKSLRRRCSKDCVLAPYFPANNPERFSCVHKVFGASNVSKNLEQLPLYARLDAANCITFEATARTQDPVYGCTGMIYQLQQQILQTHYEIERIQGEIMVHKVQEQMFQNKLDQQPSFDATLREFKEQDKFHLNNFLAALCCCCLVDECCDPSIIFF